ncbi:6-bladed beta-propeller [Parabacteroides sp. OttesenSCG-928-G06]|nr:6-bladed beta-propeller [Parabacteroides sp. OttesenSCG-928-G06]
MKRVISLLFLFLILLSCSTATKKEASEPVVEAFVLDPDIDLSEIIANLDEEMLLSEWCDSITYVPLETNTQNFIRVPSFVITSEYITQYNHLYDWTGKYLGQIGKRGQGPCEDHGQIIHVLTFVGDHFYTQGRKFLEYDKNGVCTGKSLILGGQKLWDSYRNFNRLGAIHGTKNQLVAFSYPDSVFFFSTDFEITEKYPTGMEWDKPISAQSIDSPYYKYFTPYNDTLLFYNYFTDTVYHVAENKLIPKWVIHLNEKQKISTDYTYKFEEIFLGDYFTAQQSGRLESSKGAKLLDHRILVHAIHETDNLLFILASEIMFAPKDRGLPPLSAFLVCIDKRTGAVSGAKKVVDDLGGLDSFAPKWGICNGIMVNAIWPYELQEFVDKKKANNQSVDQRLIDLLNSVDEEDNPILIFAHLKK